MNDRHAGHKMEYPEGVVLLDSLGDLQPGNTSPILVCGSHCGGNRDLAEHVRSCHVKAVFLNNAGVGKNRAGIRGLTHYEAENVLACAVDNYSAEIGIACDTYESGIISHTTSQAESVGIQIGDSVQDAIAKIITHRSLTQQNAASVSLDKEEKNHKISIKKQTQTHIGGLCITVTDSITFLNESNSGDIVVCGSHGGLSAGKYAMKYRVKAVFFNDAGIGKNDAGVKSLAFLNDGGIPACTVDCMSAEIFNGQDVLDNGIISVCNQLAKHRNIKKELMVKEAIKHI
ncbi:MAG: hypothetical protein K9N55_01255 [Phycisphaerae bacterium]|nr:hypothetical protein [Phycisphaerae bacterium]